MPPEPPSRAPCVPGGRDAAGTSVCLVPARGGSRRLPGRNIRSFCGRPVLTRSVEAALDAGCFDRVVVSTDDADIADVARAAGAEVPFVRPAALADDHASTLAVVRHALDFLARADALPTTLCCLYAATPFVRPEDLLAGRVALHDADFAMPVVPYAFPVQRAVRIDDAGRLRRIRPENHATPGPDAGQALHDAGQFYWGTTVAWRSEVPIFEQRVAPMILPRWRVQGMDTAQDWLLAEAVFRALEGG